MRIPYPDTDKLLVQNDPRQQIGTRHVRCKQRHRIGRQQRAQRQCVQEGRHLPQQAECEAAVQESTYIHTCARNTRNNLMKL